MKSKLVTFALITTFTSVFAQQAKPTVLLGYRLGGLAHEGTVTTCEVYDNSLVVRPIRAVIIQDIQTASRAPINTAQHVRAQVPSVEYYAYQNGQRVLLLQDYSNLQTRQGAEAEGLVDIIKRSCGIEQD